MASVLGKTLETEAGCDVSLQGLFSDTAGWGRTTRPIDQLKWKIQTDGKWVNDPQLKSLYLAVLQYHSQRHIHKPTCYKKKAGKATQCRFHYPLRAAEHTSVDLSAGVCGVVITCVASELILIRDSNPRPVSVYADPTVQPKVIVRRRPVFAYMVQHMPSILSFVLSNTNLQFVSNQLITYYITCYQTKNSRDEAEAAQLVIQAFIAHMTRRWGSVSNATDNRSLSASGVAAASVPAVGVDRKAAVASAAVPDAAIDRKHPFAVGAGVVISLARKWTSTDAVPAQTAAFANLQLGMFRFSHYHDRHTTIPVKQGIAFVEGQPVNGRIIRGGVWCNAVLDYVARPVGEMFDAMSWYDYIKYYEVVPIASRKSADSSGFGSIAGGNADVVDLSVGAAAGGMPLKKKRGRPARISYPLSGTLHPKRATHVVVKRTKDVMVTVSGARLGNELKLVDMSEAEFDAVTIAREREEFASRVLAMFKSFRSMSDLRSLDESYWQAFMRQRSMMIARDLTMSRYLHNAQSYYVDRGFEDQSMILEPDEFGDDDMLRWRQRAGGDANDEVEDDDSDPNDAVNIEAQVDVADGDDENAVVAALRRANMSVPSRKIDPVVVAADQLAGAMDVFSRRKSTVIDPDAYVCVPYGCVAVWCLTLLCCGG